MKSPTLSDSSSAPSNDDTTMKYTTAALVETQDANSNGTLSEAVCTIAETTKPRIKDIAISGNTSSNSRDLDILQLQQEQHAWKEDRFELEHLRKVVTLLLLQNKQGNIEPISNLNSTTTPTCPTCSSNHASPANYWKEQCLDSCHEQVQFWKEQVHSIQIENKQLRQQLADYTNLSFHTTTFTDNTNNIHPEKRRIQELELQIEKWEVLYAESAELGERQIQNLQQEIQQMREQCCQHCQYNSPESISIPLQNTHGLVNEAGDHSSLVTQHLDLDSNVLPLDLSSALELVTNLRNELKRTKEREAQLEEQLNSTRPCPKSEETNIAPSHEDVECQKQVIQSSHISSCQNEEEELELPKENDKSSVKDELVVSNATSPGTARKQLETSRLEMNHISEQWQAEREMLYSQLDIQENTIIETRALLEAVQNENKQLRQLKHSLVGIDREMEALIDSLEPLKEELAVEKRRTDEARDHVATLQKNLDFETNARKEADRKRERLENELIRTKENMGRENDELRQELATREEEVENLVYEVERLKASLEYNHDRLAVMQGALREASSAQQEVKSHFTKYNDYNNTFEALELLQAERDMLRTEVRNLYQSLEARSKQEKVLLHQVAQLRAENDSLELEIQLVIQEKSALQEGIVVIST